MSEASLPAWARELRTLLPACSQFMLSGNVHDHYLATLDEDEHGTAQNPSESKRMVVPVPDLVAAVLHAAGFQSVVAFYPGGNARVLLGDRPAPQADRGLHSLASALERLASDPERSAAILLSASRLVRDVTNLSPEEFDFFRRMDALARAPKILTSPPTTLHFNPVVWLLDHERDVPAWFAVNNPYLRSIVLPTPHTGELAEHARTLVKKLGGGSEIELSKAAEILAEQTGGMTLVALERTVAIAEEQGKKVSEIEDVARSYRVGITEDPWSQKYLLQRLKPEVEALNANESDLGHGVASTTGRVRDNDDRDDKRLTESVLGQNNAIRKTFDILIRSAMGMTAAHAPAAATRPRGVLFFAGPTGVGKTELAKAITRLLFLDERFYIRFDMSEFSAEHAADRLIGAPPGYVGHEAGGELTDAIRQRPFSVVLLDEIEKAHERILDKFLQVLDDGRLTDGKGETVYFTEALLIFTSNLGIVSEVKSTEDGRPVRQQVITRTMRLEYPKLVERIQDAIHSYFTLQLGRPELLNRIGLDNVVVFDFIDDDTARAILKLMLGRISERTRREHGIAIEIPEDTMATVEEACLQERVLEFGGRGIASTLETVLINPLAIQLFVSGPLPGGAYSLKLAEKDGLWVARLQAA